METSLAIMPESSVATFLDKAIERGTDPDSLAKLVDLYDRVQDRNAEAAFNAAIQEFQSRCPVISKNAEANKNTYADLPHIVTTIQPLLHELGLSYTFDSDMTETAVDVVCTIHHSAGHKRSSKFSATVDRAARGMNATQQCASALTYGRRYSLCMALGIVTADIDDDGNAAGRRSHDTSDAKPDAPKSQPRGRRVEANDLAELFGEWKALYGSDSRDELAEWAFRTGGVPREGAFKAGAWSIEQLRTCKQAIEVAKGVPQKGGDDDIPY